MMDPGLSPARPGPGEGARTLSFLFLGGSGLGFAMLLFLPLPRDIDRPAVVALLSIAAALGIALFACSSRVPGWILPVCLALGTTIVSLNIYYGGDANVNNEMFYLWVAFYAFHFLKTRVAIAELLLVGVAYAVVMALRHDPEIATRWAVAMGTLALAGTLTARLVGQLERWSERTRRREDALRHAEELFRSAFDDAAIGMVMSDLAGRIMRVNDALGELSGYATSELVGMAIEDLLVEEDMQRVEQGVTELLAGRQSVYSAEGRYRRADGAVMWGSLNVSVVRDAHGRPLHLIGQVHDITDRKAAEHELARRALHDPLTGLPNRALFVDRVEMALARISRTARPVAVFFIDLDRFKLVNDSLGHATGDRMLVAIGERLQRALRPNDTVSRFGGDEFTILCEDIDENDAAAVADRIRSSLAEPVVIDGHELFASASIGVSISREHTVGAEGMLRDADAAMYRAKEQGRSRFVIFDGALHLRVTERLEVENDLRRAIERDELFLVYQPLVELATGRIFGIEALLRWRHPRRGVLLPGDFIPVAEESGLIAALDHWSIREACRQLAAWCSAGRDLWISINISPRQLADPRLAVVIRGILDDTGATAQQVCLEVTETGAVDAGTAPLAALKSVGISLALDDFGAGFSSLGQIRRLPPVDILKIDRSFVAELGQHAAGNAMVAAIIGMGRALGLTVIAEGIEHEAQVHELLKLGCDRGQGFYFARPVPAGAIDGLLQSAVMGELRV